MRSRKPKEIVIDGAKYITIKVAAERLDLTYSTLYQWSDRQKTPRGIPLDIVTDKLTGHRFISEACVVNLMEDRFQSGLLSLRENLAPPSRANTAADLGGDLKDQRNGARMVGLENSSDKR
jgi:hypothetical protein